MKTTYVITEAVRGVCGVALGVNVEFEYEAGSHTPADAREQAVLDYLVSAGRAEIAKPARRATKEA